MFHALWPNGTGPARAVAAMILLSGLLATPVLAGAGTHVDQKPVTHAPGSCIHGVSTLETDGQERTELERQLQDAYDAQYDKGTGIAAEIFAAIQGLGTDPETDHEHLGYIFTTLEYVDPCSPDDPHFEVLFGSVFGDPLLFDIRLAGGALVPHAMSKNLTVVGRATHADPAKTGAFRWTVLNGLTIIGPGSGTGVSDDGAVVSGILADQQSGFRWTAANGQVALGPFLPSGMSGDGAAIAGTSFELHQQAQRWDLTNPATGTGVLTGLGYLGTGQFSEANGISHDGTTVVGDAFVSAIGGTRHAIKVIGTGVMQDLGTAGGSTNSKALAVSGDGAVIVGQSWSDAHPLVTYINAAGDAVFGDSVATRWTAATGAADLNALAATANIDLHGYTLLTAASVSDDGQFIGGEEVPVGAPANTFTTTYVLRYCDATVSAACAAVNTVISTPIAVTNRTEQQASVNRLGDDRLRVMTGEHGFAAPLLGDNSPNRGHVQRRRICLVRRSRRRRQRPLRWSRLQPHRRHRGRRRGLWVRHHEPERAVRRRTALHQTASERHFSSGRSRRLGLALGQLPVHPHLHRRLRRRLRHRLPDLPLRPRRPGLAGNPRR